MKFIQRRHDGYVDCYATFASGYEAGDFGFELLTEPTIAGHLPIEHGGILDHGPQVQSVQTVSLKDFPVKLGRMFIQEKRDRRAFPYPDRYMSSNAPGWLDGDAIYGDIAVTDFKVTRVKIPHLALRSKE